jgi:hypothetical protein
VYLILIPSDSKPNSLEHLNTKIAVTMKWESKYILLLEVRIVACHYYIINLTKESSMNIMKRLTYIFVLSMLGFYAYAGSSPGTALITDDGTQYQVQNLSQEGSSLAQALKENIESGRADNFILYIHGRGKEPGKSLKDVIPDLEKEYRSSVLMFHWFPSYKGPAGYPKEEAEAAASDLGKALDYFQDYKNSHKDEFKNVKSIMLVHSMGNIVFGKFMESYDGGKLSKGLFDTIILNSADADAKGHDKWVSKIDFTDNLYITLNEHDSILSFSAKKQRQKRLGQQTTTITGKQIPLAENATYVDFSEASVNHRYFLKSGQEGNRWLKQFYDSVMKGNSIDLNSFKGVKKVEQGNGNTIYVFKGE